jgi:PAS domain S-box-containing protein
MSDASDPSEAHRLATLRSLGILDTAPEEHFDSITQLMQQLFDVPIAIVTLVDEGRQWFKSHPGLSISETPRDIAFCALTIASDGLLVIPDARGDPRFAENPFVTGEPFVRFYAGCPLAAPDGSRIGSLALVDRRPRDFSARDGQLLRSLARIVESEINALQVTTLDKLPIGVYRSTPDGRIVDCNPALVALLGYPDRASLLSTSAWDLYADPKERDRILARADREGGLQGVETQVRRKDARTLWVRLNTFLVRDARGRPLFYVGTVEDVTERRVAEESLWDSEARQKFLLDQLPAVLWTTDVDLRFTLGQGTGLGALNLRPNEVAGTTLFQYFQTDDADFPPIAAHRRALLGEAVSYDTEWAGRAYESHVRPLTDTDGRVVGTLGIALDVTDRQRLKDAEQATTRRYRAILESALDAVIGMDADGRITDWNGRAQEMFGWSRDEAVGSEAAERIMPARYREAHRQGLRRLLAGGDAPILGRRVELAGLRRDGSEFPVELTVSALREGDRWSFNAFVADISERRQAADALREGEERNRALYQRERAGREQADRLRAATEALGSTLDLREVLALILRELQRVVPYDSASIQELRGDFMEVIAGHGFPDLERVLGTRFDVRATDNPNREVFRTRRTGVLKDAPAVFRGFEPGVLAMNPGRSWIGVPLLFGDRLIGMLSLDKLEPDFYTAEHVGLAESFAAPAAVAMENARLYAAAREELTERKRVEDQLRQAQKMEAVGRLAGGIAHDFNNLLGVILGYTGLALRRLGEADPIHAQLKQVRQAADRASSLTRQLLAFSRKQVLVPEVLDLADVVAEMSTMLRRVIGEDVELVAVPREGLGMVRADRGQMAQAILNLALNARDAMPHGGRLTLAAQDADVPAEEADGRPGLRPGRYVTLAVSDTGVGIGSDVLPRIFEPFFTTKEPGKGTGLGLSMVYGFVKQSGGYIDVDSETGRGTTFRLLLPRLPDDTARPARTAQAPAAAPPVQEAASETILLVEDEDGLREMISELLREAGYRVLEASTAERALALADAHREPIDLLLTDVVMPGQSGTQLAEALHGLRPATRVLFMSGYIDDGSARGTIVSEQSAFIQKPFLAEDLLREIRQVLSRRT